MNKEEILYNEIYERTKDFGRAHFIKEIMRLQREIKELKEKYMKLEDKYIHNVSCCNEEDCDLFCEHKELKDRIDKAVEYIEQLEENEWRCFGRKILTEILKGDKE